jgi:hypothetical protein
MFYKKCRISHEAKRRTEEKTFARGRRRDARASIYLLDVRVAIYIIYIVKYGYCRAVAVIVI